VIEAFLAPPDAPNAAPHIEVRAHAPLGRETLAAIDLDTLRQNAPVITVSPAPKLGRETLAAIYVDEDKHDAPRIAVEPARKLGRETLAAIELDIAVEGPAVARPVIPPDVRRQTLPWIDPLLAASIQTRPNPSNGSDRT
jgi:hypothetical protein